jgi:serine/threonine protein kinase
VAIKVLKTVGDNWNKEVDEFITEFSIALKVQSPHIVHFFGATTKNKLCMVMEFCEKGSLYNLLQDENVYIDWDIAFKMLEEICLGILALHNHTPSILHRDLKTLNVLVTSDLRCKLCDFGLSRFDTASSAQTLIKWRGTYDFIAPEVTSDPLVVHPIFFSVVFFLALFGIISSHVPVTSCSDNFSRFITKKATLNNLMCTALPL